MLEAVDAAPRERRTQLREIGDTSLYVSGFWTESLADKLVDVDYYIDLGGTAYGELARGGTGWTGDPFGDVFGELAENFARFVEVLMVDQPAHDPRRQQRGRGAPVPALAAHEEPLGRGAPRGAGRDSRRAATAGRSDAAGGRASPRPAFDSHAPAAAGWRRSIASRRASTSKRS